MSTHDEPAFKSYFFGKGFTDVRDVVKESWDRNVTSAKDFFSKIETDEGWWVTGFTFVLWGGVGVSVVAFGTVFFAAVTLLHIVFLSAFFLLIYICFSVVWSIERIYLTFRRFFVACPNCHVKSALPEYLCDKCGNVQAMLVPNSYGILYHKCTCGQKLPATFFLNRGRLQARCPSPICHQFLHREHMESSRIFIPILGGPTAGKTAFMFSVVRQLVEEKAKQLGFSAEFIDSKTKSEYEQVIRQFKAGKVPTKTTDRIPKAFNLTLRKKGKTKWLMYIYDPAGEAFQDTENLQEHRYNEYLSGMVLIVDPFSIPAVRREYEKELSHTWSNIQPSQLNVEDALARVVITMEESFGLGKTQKITKPLAVVISKVDAFGLEKIIGESAIDKDMMASGRSDRVLVRNELIRNQFAKWGESGILQQLDTRFSTVRYFSCSALGRIPDSSGKDLVSQNVFEPILWLASTVSSEDFKIGNT